MVRTKATSTRGRKPMTGIDSNTLTSGTYTVSNFLFLMHAYARRCPVTTETPMSRNMRPTVARVASGMVRSIRWSRLGCLDVEVRVEHVDKVEKLWIPLRPRPRQVNLHD